MIQIDKKTYQISLDGDQNTIIEEFCVAMLAMLDRAAEVDEDVCCDIYQRLVDGVIFVSSYIRDEHGFSPIDRLIDRLKEPYKELNKLKKEKKHGRAKD